MNFKQELLKNILFKGVNVLLSFVVTVLVVRLLGPQGNGVYSLFMTNSAIIALVAGFSFNSGLAYYSAKNKFSAVSLLNSTLLLLILQMLFIFLSERVFKIIFGYSFYLDLNSPQITLWGWLYLFVVLLNSYLTAFFTGNKWFDTLNILTVLSNIIFILVFGFLIFSKNSYSLEHSLFILKTYILLVSLQALIKLLVLLRKIKFRLQFSFLKMQQLKKVLLYSGVAFFANIFQFLAYRMDYWFVNYYRTKDELGLYALSAKLNQVLWLLPMTIATVIIPFTVTSQEELSVKLKTILRLLLNGYIFLGIFLVAVSPFFIPLIFGNDYRGAVLPFILLLPGVVIFTQTTILGAYFAGINRQDINLKISFFCFFTILLGDAFLVPRFGKEGAAIASSLGYALSGFTSLYVFSKLPGNSFKEQLLIRKNDFKTLRSLLLSKFKSDV
ncbi:MAG: oligosaccharide flippase family protein [Ginsengibacter sp.]